MTQVRTHNFGFARQRRRHIQVLREASPKRFMGRLELELPDGIIDLRFGADCRVERASWKVKEFIGLREKDVVSLCSRNGWKVRRV